MQPDDAELVTRSQSGDLAAFNTIVERYQGQVFSVAARTLGNPSSAEDVTQETFIAAHRAIRGFRGGSLRAWLFRIATNKSHDLGRASRRRQAESLDQALLNPHFQLPSNVESPEQQAIRGELASEIQRGILTLPTDQRTTLVLVDVQGLSYEEAAQASGASVGTVKSRLSRARARLRDYLMQRRELLPEEFRQL